MNIPNKLTVLRVLLVPVFVVFMLVPFPGEWSKWAALAVFILASLTDLADGKIARKYGLVTNFGKFMDPLADKLLVCSALICFVETDQIPAAIVIVIVARELIISGVRLIAADNGVVLAANIWGKFKTTCQMVMTVVLIADINGLEILEQILIYASLILTVISLGCYLYQNRGVLKEGTN
ncbi:MAG: CDP-diacylglycerol--glycerol-3-phosphate 3-phosphatidyltransferase [Lachnospiraceae bacterium]|nr:CDP-diacylglycerol--glycerol-3-phosphate 3-phosphatidyltransferase [Candidatus Fimimorpha excrementavium]